MSAGAAPPGVSGEKQTADWVRGMFGRVAHRYDLLNHLLSFQMDRWWRVRTVRRLQPVLDRPDARTLDICCGSGDLMLALSRSARGAVLGSDFCHPMLVEARKKVLRRGSPARVFEADALRLPLPDASLDLITVAFGFRNLANYRAGLAEMRRVLQPGGTVAILEFSTPPNRLFRGFYHFYSAKVMPMIGGIVSGSREAYSYLPDSVRKFPGAVELADEMRAAGFDDVTFDCLTGGIVALHIGVRGR
ncbi:MAG: bifunctional demethylmenaquinone methyltransferase/2-methoxy-6-polyprenyl-1,4-benzoquinol methylase UbiE [bacterium]|nr:bifunctional demethylmenaquinone methyltransferase/2-methoxy-6-polyprenyl-1,4-benzoquinol methylase UbiE [bacterium]